jgi:predicted Zn-dependent protease with MMP-like domain
VSGGQPTTRRILLSAVAALTVGLGAVSLIAGFSDSVAVRLLQGLAVFAAGAVILGGGVVLALVHLAGWRDPESEEEFEAIVQRAERLAAEGYDPAPAGGQDDVFDDEDEYGSSSAEDEDFRALVRAAIDDLPLEFHRALEHVAVVISDGGRSRRAYGLYQGDTVARDYFHDRIIIFRDTLLRDFGHDPELLRAQVTRTLRHELAHHLGWDEKGVRGLGL